MVIERRLLKFATVTVSHMGPDDMRWHNAPAARGVAQNED